MRKRFALALSIVAVLAVDSPTRAQEGAVRIKDVATLQGARSQPLVGYGLVVGLNKTGDRRQTLFSAQTLANMLLRFGVVVPGEEIKVENIAAVMITTDLPPFARPGARLDVTVSSVGDARSLQGGTLLPAPLRAPDGTVTALAQGPLTIGGFGGGKGDNSVQVNHLTVGRVPNGAVLQVAHPLDLQSRDSILLALNEADFGTARRVAEAIAAELGQESAHAVDAATVAVRVPTDYRTAIADLLARLEVLTVRVDAPARVVINERTGTVVVGANVRIGPAAVAHGNLSVRIRTQFGVSQPGPLSRGQTVVVPDQQVEVVEGNAQLMELQEGTTLDAVVRALNALGASPRDIIAIMQALKAAGALRAELVII
ncbi:MAG: flagellar basal body P-ring protein FlgI [Acidobacteria bacterium]|nr:flagellar basal body P-ring protein FlgI [Acidobacteriota bacterium]